jgi:prephenate dehydratase
LRQNNTRRAPILTSKGDRREQKEKTTVETSPRSVAIQGVAGAFSHEAAEKLFGMEIELIPTRTFDELMAAVATGMADVGVVPVENTLAGFVQGNLDRVLENSLAVVAETRVRVRLCLLAPPGRMVEEIRTAASHPVALQQCTGFFRAHPGIEPVAVYDTAGSVQDLMKGDAGYDSAIGSSLAASRYGAEVLHSGIEDDPRNHTRFFAVSRRGGSIFPWVSGLPRKADKTTLAFVVAHEPGSLHAALGVFAGRGVDLTKLESRPMPGRPWEYRFYADVRGDPEGAVGECLAELRELAAELQVLGSYREWTEADDRRAEAPQ